MLGHQGSSAAYPIPFSYVTLDHLRDAHADGSAHNRDNCAFEERSAEDLDSDYIENVANTTGPQRKTGKDSRSIIGASLFPLQQGVMHQVVVPFLHVFTGAFCILEKKIFLEVLQNHVSSDIQIETRSKIEELSIMKKQRGFLLVTLLILRT